MVQDLHCHVVGQFFLTLDHPLLESYHYCHQSLEDLNTTKMSHIATRGVINLGLHACMYLKHALYMI